MNRPLVIDTGVGLRLSEFYEIARIAASLPSQLAALDRLSGTDALWIGIAADSSTVNLEDICNVVRSRSSSSIFGYITVSLKDEFNGHLWLRRQEVLFDKIFLFDRNDGDKGVLEEITRVLEVHTVPSLGPRGPRSYAGRLRYSADPGRSPGRPIADKLART